MSGSLGTGRPAGIGPTTPMPRLLRPSAATATVASTTASSGRPSFAASADAIQALVPASGGQAPTAAAIPVRIVYTGQFLLTVHSGPARRWTTRAIGMTD